MSEENKEEAGFDEIINFFKKLKKPQGIELFDYFMTIQLVGFIIWSLKVYHKYEMVIVYFSAIAFIGWWLFRIVFAKFKPLPCKLPLRSKEYGI